MRSHLLLRRRSPFAPRAGRSPQQQQQPPNAQQQQQQQQQSTSSGPYAEIMRIRKVKKVGIGLSAAALAGSAAAVAAGSGPELLPAFEAAAKVSGALAAAAALSLAGLKLGLGERLHLEVEGARLFVEVLPEFSAPSPSPRPDGRPHLVVRDAGDGRGRGVYVRESLTSGRDGGIAAGGEQTSILRGSFLGCYEGDLLDERGFWDRYPAGIGDYCIGCGGGFCLDGAPLAQELRESSGDGRPRYSPCLINHSSKRANLCRITRRREKRVELYASRDLVPGEELLLDYGKKYWQGREAEEKD